MSYSKDEIIDHNLKKLYNSNPQYLNVIDFELLDLNVFSHPKELVGEIESLGLIELDQNETDYYLTEEGYDCLEAGRDMIKVKKNNFYFEEKPIVFSTKFQKSPERLKFVFYLLIAFFMMTGIIYFINKI